MMIRKEANKEIIGINIYLQIIMLNVNGLKSPDERNRLIDWFKKQKNLLLPTRNTPH
jgi:hypothetical protein